MSRATTQQPLKRREFMDEVKRAFEASLQLETSEEIRSRSTMNLLKLHFNANYRIHYELMISSQQGIVELGLHFEDGPDSTTRLLEFFDQYVIEVKHQLGTGFELERWTRSWGHFFETHPLDVLTQPHARQLGERLAEIVAVLQPILDEAVALGLAADIPRPGSGRPRFRRRM